ncbi:hypothetical protein M1N46_01585 [Dehalococcoidia bacterium]|nr:hypothetical protein [Dehalococcoidia bacterium]
MDAKLRQEIEEVLAEASLREFSTDLKPFIDRIIMPLNDEAEDALTAIFQSYLASSPSPVRAMWKAFTVGQAWQRLADEALLGRQ